MQHNMNSFFLKCIKLKFVLKLLVKLVILICKDYEMICLAIKERLVIISLKKNRTFSTVHPENNSVHHELINSYIIPEKQKMILYLLLV